MSTNKPMTEAELIETIMDTYGITADEAKKILHEKVDYATDIIRG